MLNSAIISADIGRGWEEYVEIFDAFYADEVEVTADETGPIPLPIPKRKPNAGPSKQARAEIEEAPFRALAVEPHATHAGLPEPPCPPPPSW